MIKRIFKIILVVILLIVIYLSIRTVTFRSVQLEVTPISLPVLEDASLERFAAGIRIKTISVSDTLPADTASFVAFHDHLQASYPLVDSLLIREPVADLSLLYTWAGTNPDLKPIILIGHMDVVPIEESSVDEWQYPPFSGIVADGYIWGRGSLDDKITVFTVLEAVERLLAEGFQPERTVYLGFGHDEEVRGAGAKAIVKTLQSRNVQAEFVLDEGGVVTQGLVPGVAQDVAVVSISEKGYLSMVIEVELKEGGHSSMPPQETSTEILAKALVSIRENQFPARMSEPISQMFDYLGPEMAFPYNVIFANKDLLGGVITGILSSSSPSGNASVRTTTAPTMVQAGVQDNILPTRAKAVVNFRLLPGDSFEDVQNHLSEVINDDRVKIYALPGVSAYEASVVSSTESFGFKVIQQSIKEVFPDTHVAPNLAVGYSDVRNYQPLSNDLYRFLPFRAHSEDLARIHGVNERLSLEDFRRGIGFYEQLIRNGTQAP